MQSRTPHGFMEASWEWKKTRDLPLKGLTKEKATATSRVAVCARGRELGDRIARLPVVQPMDACTIQ